MDARELKFDALTFRRKDKLERAERHRDNDTLPTTNYTDRKKRSYHCTPSSTCWETFSEESAAWLVNSGGRVNRKDTHQTLQCGSLLFTRSAHRTPGVDERNALSLRSSGVERSSESRVIAIHEEILGSSCGTCDLAAPTWIGPTTLDGRTCRTEPDAQAPPESGITTRNWEMWHIAGAKKPKRRPGVRERDPES
ncbi:hypothetical protein GLOTRDRAFT_92062 [Gloeophyllum trabeum ATCC 11539]|uniref:Uncharacterized protein n=1 Tax=Gloeophyllum trabeum (strain ATCC 11539 / FP-39264 / Madison 617) TaxID=670483 RepID=S7RQH9_GLOTA|nr:uncharacterized protein GLOTRDRAFT_92062 [Gloeophyllum trabeum ATCC 11539]EPQ56840.1 hypothetical protein GLOTRDRAFT_92062 [Gloeophyllum trabeum ATCC 11539]